MILLPELPSPSPPLLLAALALSIAAAWQDWFEWRIANRLLAPAAAAAFMLASFAPGAPGLAIAVAGALTGLALLLPFYLAGGVGGGDVKLLATLGILLGPVGVFETALLSCLLGGVWAVALLMLRTAPAQLLLTRLQLAGLDLRALCQYRRAPAPLMRPGSGGTIPYGVVISIAAAVLAVGRLA